MSQCRLIRHTENSSIDNQASLVGKVRRAAFRPPCPSNCEVALDAFDVLCLPALRALHDVELNLLTFLQAAKAVCLDGGEVNENVLAILAADKAIALGIVKPLYCSCFHDVAVFLLC